MQDMRIDIPPKPEGSLWTDEQWQAIKAKGQDILVAAAAGSGKTAVLVERMIHRILDTEDPVDVDRLLIVTFTNAAAAEMKTRIGEALEQALEQNPDSLYLKRQLTLLNKASISTLHSFCLDVMRRYYYQLDLDPKFRVAEDTEVALIQEEVFETLFEEWYAQSDHEAFYDLVDRFSTDRSDIDLQRLVLQLYHFSRSHPFPNQWLAHIVQSYQNVDDFFASCTKALCDHIQGECQSWLDQIDTGLALTQELDGPEAYAVNLEADRQIILELLQAASEGWDSLCTAFESVSFGRLKACKGDHIDAQKQNRVKQLRDRIKKEVSKRQEEWFSRPKEAHKEDILSMGRHIQTLVSCVQAFATRYDEIKRKKAIVDFSDLEHLCLDILMQEGSTLEAPMPSEVALSYKQRFAEILVDEYQDTNLVQETILQLIRQDDPGNLFMVGDVKQSIYRFRMAEPGLFIQKYKHFTPIDDMLKTDGPPPAMEEDMQRQDDPQQKDDDPQRDNTQQENPQRRSAGAGVRIDLARNFRSRREVLEGTNFLFYQLMSEQLGEVPYDEAAALKVGASYPEEDVPVEVAMIDREELDVEAKGHASTSTKQNDFVEDTEDPTIDLENVQLEARYIGQKIRTMIGHEEDAPTQIYDTKTQQYRSLQYRDIVILLRATSTWAPVILEELKQQGIPAYSELTTGYFEATEVAMMLSLLKVIDNPYQDIPFASVLRSPFVQLDGEALAHIRIHQQKGSFYEAFRACLTSPEGDSEDSDQAVRDAHKNDLDDVEEATGSIHLEAPHGDTDARPVFTSELQKRLYHFDKQLQQWRTKARQGSLADLIWQIYQDTGYYDYVGGMPGGQQRQANLRALYDRARQYESTSFRGLFRFLRFIERMQDQGRDLGTARALGEQEDVVRVITIHKSKGLEFPVVFVAGLNKNFNRMDLNQKVLLHKTWGLGTRVIDTEQRISYPTLPYGLLKQQMEKEMLAEEMRVLYVALTRAKERLVLVGTLKETMKHIGAWLEHAHHRRWVLPDLIRLKAKTFFDWMGPALVRHRHSHPVFEKAQVATPAGEHHLGDHVSSWRLTFVPASTLVAVHTTDQQKQEARLADIQAVNPVPEMTEHAEEIHRRLTWQYPSHLAQTMLAKQSVTEIKKQQEWKMFQEETLEMSPVLGEAEQQQPIVDRPRFLQAHSLTATERGTAVHVIMQHLPLGQSMSMADMQRFVQTLVDRELLDPTVAEDIDLTPLVAFSDSDINHRLQEASWIEREMPFSYTLPASDIQKLKGEQVTTHLTQLSDDKVLMQGVIDCLFEHEGELILLDYKTDTIHGPFPQGFTQAKPVLAKRYELQLNLYAKAIEDIWQQRVKEKILYFFDGGYVINVNDANVYEVQDE
ncbi:helicase-exonuclease AddAB subunit AddA [Caldalkalibacillus salinus]|uniref:helicase-exonuclease AddAB subunit AddA n=1 Tax=Caldalkalibacillus salinus TaxID=2803787 RepID=UPI00192477BE|nr:helicase-exonuclease AddAB subunit AddA [Caldalkalibacillus salinus]